MGPGSLEFFISFRYLKAKRKGLFASVTTGIGVAGVTVGVAALLTTLSVMNGFQTDIQKKIVGAQAHMTIHGTVTARTRPHLESSLQADPEVAAIAPFVLGQAILTHNQRSLASSSRGRPRPGISSQRPRKTLREGD